MPKKLRRILVPIDFSEHSREALDYASLLARQFKATLDVLHCWTPPLYVAPDIMLAMPGWSAMTMEEFSRAEANKAVDAFLDRFDRAGLEIGYRIETGDPAETILRVAAEGYDLIVMGTHGRTGLTRLLMGSVTMKVAGQSRCPVLTVHAPPEPGPGPG